MAENYLRPRRGGRGGEGFYEEFQSESDENEDYENEDLENEELDPVEHEDSSDEISDEDLIDLTWSEASFMWIWYNLSKNKDMKFQFHSCVCRK